MNEIRKTIERIEKKISVLLFIMLTLVLGLSSVYGQSSNTKNVVKISYELLDKYQENNLSVNSFNINAKNTGLTPICNVRINLEPNSVTSSPDHYFEIINSEETKIFPLEITFNSMEEPPRLIWNIEYVDTNGNQIKEAINN